MPITILVTQIAHLLCFQGGVNSHSIILDEECRGMPAAVHVPILHLEKEEECLANTHARKKK